MYNFKNLKHYSPTPKNLKKKNVRGIKTKSTYNKYILPPTVKRKCKTKQKPKISRTVQHKLVLYTWRVLWNH